MRFQAMDLLGNRFKMEHCISPRRTCDPHKGRAKFDPMAILWALLVEAH